MDIHELRDEQGEVIHACATASFPLPSDHWIYKNPVRPAAIGGDHSELTRVFRMQVREALKYTIQVCTSRGKDPDFDPDAMWMTLDNTLFGDNERLSYGDEADKQQKETSDGGGCLFSEEPD